MYIDKLPEGITMQLLMHPPGSGNVLGNLLYSSSKGWLHPLFDLEEFLSSKKIDGNMAGRIFEFDGGLQAGSSDLLLRDRIIGLAAAFLIVRMGIRQIETDIISLRALPLLKKKSITIETNRTIEKTKCITEDLLNDLLDPEEAYMILSERRTKALGRV